MTLKIVKEAPPPEDWTAIMPCPFCSGPGKLLTSTFRSDPDIGESSCVICENPKCGAAGPMIGGNGEYLKKDVMEKRAINRWNKRGNLAGAETKLRRIAAILNSNQ
jgi:hypothetical protein